MFRSQVAVPTAALLLLGGLLLAGRPPAAAQAGKGGAAAPGDLAIVDQRGQVTGQCPLKHTSVSADIAGFVARVNVTQEFRNPSKEPIEAMYTFPLPDDAAVDDMTMTIGPRLVKGEIKRREEARKIYEAARSAGQAAALLDQERPNIFTQSVANIMPGQDVKITISYVNLLKYDEGTYEFAFPMVVGPRYNPSGGYSGSGRRGDPAPPAAGSTQATTPVVTDPEKITPPVTPPDTRAGHDISVSVNLDVGLPLAEVKSQLHSIMVERDGANRAKIRLKEERVIPNKDFILRYSVAGDQMQTGVLANAPGTGSGYFTLILQPPSAPAQKDVSPKEMVFVIDQTGSQSGLPIQKAKETIRYCLENLNPGDTFQVLGFNTQVYPCFSEPAAVTPENMKRAREFVEPLQGNGGTDILKAVDYALKIKEDPARPRIICYMTDGYVGSDMQILDYIGKNRGRARMFPFGVGNSVNRFLIEGMARQGRGVPYYVDLKTPGEKAASKFYQRVSKPLLLDPEVEWNGLPVEDVYPKHLPDVFSAAPIILKGRYKGSGEGDITVRGLLRGQPWEQKVHVSLPAVRKEGAAIPTLWAREKVEDLQSKDWLGAQSGNPDPKIKEQIVGLALDYRLMSQYTSFVAVEEKVVNIGGKQRRVDVPVEMPEGVSYEGIFGETAQGGQALGLLRAAPAQNYAFYAQPRGAVAGKPMSAGAAGGLSTAPAATPPLPAPATRRESKNAPSGGAGGFGGRAGGAGFGRPLAESEDLADRLKQADKPLAEMKPEERRAALQQMKLAPSLHDLAAVLKKEGVGSSLNKPGRPEVVNGRALIQVWLANLPTDGLKKLKALGFETVSELRGKQLLLGTLPVAKLDALAELPFVQWVEPPRFK